MNFTRSWDILTPHLIRDTTVTMIGLGGIGAAAAVTLAKMGVKYFELYDPDEVEDVNIPTQLLRISDVGKPKVTSVITLMKDIAEVTGIAHVARADLDTRYSTCIVISAVDTIDARKDIWFGATMSEIDWYLDARMGSQHFQLRTVNMNTGVGWYDSELMALNEDDVPDEPCTAKATFYCAMIGAGIIGNQVKRIVMNQIVPRVIVFDIPSLQLVVPSGETLTGGE